MHSKFDHVDISNEKVQKIINCAFEEFSKNKFEKASTNHIVKAAGVSRGLLYHYFKDKQDLFDFLIYHSIRISMEDLEQKIDWEETDFLKRLKQSIALRFELTVKYPYLLEFYQQNKDNEKMQDTRKQVYLESARFRRKYYEHNIDHSNVKEGIDVTKMVNVIRWTLKQMSSEYWDKVQSNGEIFKIEELISEMDEYIEFLRKAFYK